MISILEVDNNRLFRQFIDLPYEIHKGQENWLPPIYSDDKSFFKKARYNLYEGNKSILLLAFINNRPVGRVMAIVPKQYNSRHNLSDVRFNYLESIDDYTILKALLDYVSQWGQAKGCDTLVGPLGFSDKEPQGLEIEGMENPPLILTNMNFPYITKFIRRYGMSKKIDLISFGIKVPDTYPDEYFEKYQSFLPLHSKLAVLNLKTRWGLLKYLRPAMNLINELFEEIYAHNPLKKKDINALVKRFILLLRPNYLKGIVNEKGELIAFVIGIPDIVEGIQQCKGRLFPFGFLKVLRSQRTSKELLLMIGGIKKEYRNMGLDYWLSLEIFKTVSEDNIKIVKGHLILEDNFKALAKLQKFGGFVNKRFRIFQKAIG